MRTVVCPPPFTPTFSRTEYVPLPKPDAHRSLARDFVFPPTPHEEDPVPRHSQSCRVGGCDGATQLKHVHAQDRLQSLMSGETQTVSLKQSHTSRILQNCRPFAQNLGYYSFQQMTKLLELKLSLSIKGNVDQSSSIICSRPATRTSSGTNSIVCTILGA